jgi:hypothetical protein
MDYDEMNTVSKMKVLTVHERGNSYALSLNLNILAVWTKFDTFYFQISYKKTKNKKMC